jgi:hypothetical protein
MAKRGRQVSPIFNLPDGLLDYEYEDFYNPTGFVDYDDEVLVDEQPIGGLPTPNALTVVEQIIRTLPDGSQVVDVVVEVDDVEGAVKYEFRIVKADELVEEEV